MKRALFKFNPDYSHMNENLKRPCTDDERLRLERGLRRMRRREARSDSLKHNGIASAIRTTAKISGNTAVKNDHMIDDGFDEDWAKFMATFTGDDDDDEVDEDYGPFLPTHNPVIENDSDEVDEDYKYFMSTCNLDIENDSDEVDEDYKSFMSTFEPDIENDNDEVDVDYGSFLPTDDPDVQIHSANNHSGCSNIDVDFGKNKEDSGLVLNSDAVGTSSSLMIVDGDEEYMCDKNTKNTTQVEDGCNSSDSDLIILDSYLICQDTPFVPSKTYDPSWFEEEMNGEDNMQVVYDDSRFRRRLMECLDKPYDQKEYEDLITKLSKKNQKQRHLETRRTVIESYQYEGITTPLYETYPDIAEAIAKVSKKKPKVLFILRGFFFWLENVSHMGAFQPWNDESCMELLRKM